MMTGLPGGKRGGKPGSRQVMRGRKPEPWRDDDHGRRQDKLDEVVEMIGVLVALAAPVHHGARLDHYTIRIGPRMMRKMEQLAAREKNDD